MRTIVDIPEEVIATLDEIREQEQRSRASIIRDALKVYLEKRVKKLEDAEAFGIWKKRKKDGIAYQEDLRAEWE